MTPRNDRITATPRAILVAALLSAASLDAGTDLALETEDTRSRKGEPAIYDKIWGLATLYNSDDNPIIEELKLRGRYHGQYHWLDSRQGRDEGWEDRRSRFGIDAKCFDKKLELRFDVQSSDGFDPLYAGIVDAYLVWRRSEDFNLTVGRQKPQLGAFDFLPSSNFYATFQRAQIFNQLNVDRTVGAVVDGKTGNFTYQAGIYSNDIDLEFGHFNAGIAYGAGIGYDLKHLFHAKRTDLRFDWLHSDIEPDSTILNRYMDLFSATFWIEESRWTFAMEAYAGSGHAPDVFGLLVQPTYDIILKKLQLVGRYTFSKGDGPDSVIAQSRYERAAPDLTGGGRGDRYQAGYIGLQYFIHGDRLKLMSGVEYAGLKGGGNGGDFNGWTALSGVHFSF